MERLPQVRDIALHFASVDIIDDPAPIQPTAHYSMGGIPTDNDGRVLANAEGDLVTGFFAAGEVACVSVHGANRLGTNSLLEASVFGRRAGAAIAEFINDGAELHPVSGDPAAEQRERVQNLMDVQSEEPIEDIAQELKTTMTDKCGIFRDDQKLNEALDKISELKERFAKAGVMDKSTRFNTDILAALETQNLLTFSEVIVAGALARTESRGAHSRTDHPKRDDDNWIKHTVAHKNGDDGPTLSYRDVVIDWEKYPPQERKY